jgi:hypothetical protein
MIIVSVSQQPKNISEQRLTSLGAAKRPEEICGGNMVLGGSGHSDSSVAMSANTDYHALKAWQGAAQQNGCYRISASF